MTTTDGIRAALSWLATYAVHSTAFLGSAWALCRLCPPRVNRNKERLWKLALVGGVLSATLQVALGTNPLLGRLDWSPLLEQAPEPSAKQSPEPAAEPPEDLPPSLASGFSSPVTAPPAELAPPTTIEAQPIAAGVRRPEGVARTLALRARNPILPAASRAARSTPPRFAERETAAVRATGGHPSPRDPAEAKNAQTPGLDASPSPLWLTSTERVLGRIGPDRWPGLVLLGWSGIGLIGLLGLLGSWTCLRRRMLGRTLLRDGSLVEALDRVRRRAGVRRHVRLSISPRITSPFSTGLFRPEVCVPSAVLTALTRSQQEALLAHELAHLVRRDPAWFGLGYLIETLLFFQPLNRLARRQLAELAELACDDWAVRWTGARVALASCLAEVAGWVIGERPLRLAPPGLAGQRSRLRHRVERLLDDRRSPAGDPRTPWWPPVSVAALALVALAMPGVAAVREPRAVTGPSTVPESSTVPASRGPDRDPRSPASEEASRLQASALVPEATTDPRTTSATSSPGWTAPQAADRPDDLSAERLVMREELALLEAELVALRAEFEARSLATRFADALTRIDARMEQLRRQERRLGEQLAALLPNTPVLAPAPAAQPPASTVTNGESR